MKKERALENKSLLFVYGSLFLVCCLTEFFTHRSVFWSWWQSQLAHPAFVGIGFFFVFFYVGSAILSLRLFRWAAELEKLFSQVLTPFSYFQIILLAALSGFIEEWFFRGILLTQFGLVMSSIFFGLAHFLPYRSVWRWSFISLFAGILLGLLYTNSGSLVLVSVVHATINGILLYRLNVKHLGAPSLT